MALSKRQYLNTYIPRQQLSTRPNYLYTPLFAVYGLPINEQGILFFTQQGRGKVIQLEENPRESIALWLPLQQKQINFEGTALPLSREENQRYWNTLPKERQLRFLAYAPTSSQPIESLAILENTLHKLTNEFKDTFVPMSAYYCGFPLDPKIMYFYTLSQETFSEYIQFCYSCEHNKWIEQLLSP